MKFTPHQQLAVKSILHVLPVRTLSIGVLTVQLATAQVWTKNNASVMTKILQVIAMLVFMAIHKRWVATSVFCFIFLVSCYDCDGSNGTDCISVCSETNRCQMPSDGSCKVQEKSQNLNPNKSQWYGLLWNDSWFFRSQGLRNLQVRYIMCGNAQTSCAQIRMTKFALLPMVTL